MKRVGTQYSPMLSNSGRLETINHQHVSLFCSMYAGNSLQPCDHEEDELGDVNERLNE